MPQDVSRSRRSRAAVLAALLVGLAVVFSVPFHMPVAPTVSDSYTFGFNNRAALVLFVLFAFGFAWWSRGLGLRLPEPEEAEVGPAMSRRLLWVTLGVTAVVTVGFSLAYRRVGAINEGAYLLDRLQHWAAGERMYRDFEFIYGPLLLFTPLLLHRWLHVTLLDGYYASWVVDWVGGVWLLWLTVRWACAGSARKNGIYLLAFLGFIFSVVSLGLNYTPLRFVSGPFFAVAVWRVMAARRSAVAGAALSVAGAAWTLFFSPEQGIAFCGGTLLFFALFVRKRYRDALPAMVVLVAGQAVLLTALWRSGVVHYMHGIAEGGYNLPLLPSLSTVLLLLLVLVAVCALVNSVRSRSVGGPLAYLTLVSVCALPAAFGRCDGGHMFMNTLGAFLAAWAALSGFRNAGRWMAWSYVASAVFLPLALYQANNFFMFPVKAALFSPADPHPAVRMFAEGTLRRVLGERRSEAMLAKWRAAYPLVVASDVPAGKVLLAPLGYPSTLLLEVLPPVTNGRYRGLGNVMAPYEVQEKIAELRDHPGSLLLFTGSASCPRVMPVGALTAQALTADDHAKRRELFLNLLPLYVPHVRHHEDLLAPVCGYVTAHYRPTELRAPLVGGEIWEREPGSGQ